jgi:two-component system LytT family sensor kinase
MSTQPRVPSVKHPRKLGGLSVVRPSTRGDASGKLWLWAVGGACLIAMVRTVQITQTVSDLGVGIATPWLPVAANQFGFVLGWAATAGLIIPLARLATDRRWGAGRLAALSLAFLAISMVVPPLIAAPVHMLTFGPHAQFAFAHSHILKHDLLINILLGAAVSGGVFAFFVRDRSRREELAAAELRDQLTSSRLDTLRAQLNPHFLFNALNSVTTLARQGATAEVIETVTSLSALLRYSLEDMSTQLVPLRAELHATNSYLAIEKMRFRDRLTVHVDVPAELEDAQVPSFVLQPIVENAVRHGVERVRRDCNVWISAARVDARICLRVENDGADLPEDYDPTDDRIGLANTRARLAALYHGGASLSLHRRTPAGVFVEIWLPLQPMSSQ